MSREGVAGAMTDAHCDRCATYEEAVMAARAEDEEPDPTVLPCDDYAMSERFKAWLVEAMRAEVLGQISDAGLDRMAVLGSAPEASAGGASKEQDDEEE